MGYTLQIAEGWTAVLPKEVNEILLNRTDRTWPFDVVCAAAERNERFLQRVQRDGELGSEPRSVHVRAHRERPHHAWRACCASRCHCTTSRTRTSIVRTPGARSARRTWRAPITGRAPTTNNCINKGNLRKEKRAMISLVFLACKKIPQDRKSGDGQSGKETAVDAVCEKSGIFRTALTGSPKSIKIVMKNI